MPVRKSGFLFPFRQTTVPQLHSKRVWIISFLSGTFFFHTAVQARTEETLVPYVRFSYSHDDNVMRFSNAEQARTIIGTDETSDTIRRTEAGVLINKKIGRQVLSANYGVYRTQFSRFNELDHTGRDLQTKLNWHLANEIEGNIGFTSIKALTPFVDFRRLQPNLRTQNRKFLDGSWRYHPSWRLVAGISESSLQYELRSQQAGNRDESIIETGIDYLPPSGNSIGLRVRRIAGEFPDSPVSGVPLNSNDYKQDEMLARMDWRWSGKTLIQFSGGYVTRRHEAFSERNWSGANGRLTATWNPTGKTSVVTSLWRETGSYLDLTTSYTVNKGISVTPVWNITHKLLLEGLLRHEKRDFAGTGIYFGPAEANRKDAFRYYSLALVYTPVPRLQLKFAVYHDKRNSSEQGNEYRSRGGMLTAGFEF